MIAIPNIEPWVFLQRLVTMPVEVVISSASFAERFSTRLWFRDRPYRISDKAITWCKTEVQIGTNLQSFSTATKRAPS